MIDLYSGTPGSGKSLHVAKKIYWALKMNRPVICNFQINQDVVSKKRKYKFYFKDNSEITPDYLMQFSREYFNGKRIIEDQILLVIDEAQLLFNAREWNKTDRAAWLSFFTQHRKFGYHVILVAQFDGMLDKQIRALIEYNYIHRKFSNFGWRGIFLSLVFGGHAFIAVRVWYPMNMKVDHEIFHAKKRFFSIYDTYGSFTKT